MMLSMALPPATFVFEPFESEFSRPRNAASHELFRCTARQFRVSSAILPCKISGHQIKQLARHAERQLQTR